MAKTRQPLNEADYNVLAEQLVLYCDTLGQDPKMQRRLTVLARRLAEFRDDLRTDRAHEERVQQEYRERELHREERARAAHQEGVQRFLAQRDPDETGPWVIFLPSQNFDLQGSSGPSYAGIVNGTWREAVEAAWAAMKGLLGSPIIEKAQSPAPKA